MVEKLEGSHLMSAHIQSHIKTCLAGNIITTLPVVVVVAVCVASLCESPLVFSVLPHVDWALWLCCLQGQGEKGETLVSSAKQAWGYRQAWGRWCGHRGHTLTHTHIHPCSHADIHTYTHTQTYIEVRSKDSVNLTHNHTCAAAQYASHFLHVCVFPCVFGPGSLYLSCLMAGLHADVITGGIPCEQGHWMTSWQAVMNVIYTCRLSK